MSHSGTKEEPVLQWLQDHAAMVGVTLVALVTLALSTRDDLPLRPRGAGRRPKKKQKEEDDAAK